MKLTELVTLEFVVRKSDDEPVALCSHPEDAAAIVALYGEGTFIQYYSGETLWVDGVDGIAAESYDLVAQVCFAKLTNLGYRGGKKST